VHEGAQLKGYTCPTCGGGLDFVLTKEHKGAKFDFTVPAGQDEVKLAFVPSDELGEGKEEKPVYDLSWACPRCGTTYSKAALAGQAARGYPDLPAGFGIYEDFDFSALDYLFALRRHKRAPTTLFDYPHHTHLGKHTFTIPGLGKSGPYCRHQRLKGFSPDGKKAYYGLLKCQRIECPSCWDDWARRTVFWMALEIEAYAHATNQRPYMAIFSVREKDVRGEDWDWERVNTSLFHRGYRRGKNIAGIDGGYGIFHPFRLNRRALGAPTQLEDVADDISMWMKVRAMVNEGKADLNYLTKFGPHTHALVFGSPKEHTCEKGDFILRFKDDGYGRPIELPFVEEGKDGNQRYPVVGYLMYLITHTGILTIQTQYNRYLRDRQTGKFILDEIGEKIVKRKNFQRKQTHTIRAWGCLYRIDPKELLGEAEYHDLAHELANAVGMAWDEEAEDIYYPGKNESKNQRKEIEIIPIWKIFDYLAQEEWINKLSQSQLNFWNEVAAFLRANGITPDPDDLKPPDDIEAHFEIQPKPAKPVEKIAIAPAELIQPKLEEAPKFAQRARVMSGRRYPPRCGIRGLQCTVGVFKRCPLAGKAVCTFKERW